jgi:DNA-binding MarR family transcriptional regulator
MSGYFYHVPALAADDPSLTRTEQMFYGLIWSLMQKHGFCWSTNDELAELFRCSKRNIQRYIKKLKDLGYIVLEIPTGQRRRIWTQETHANKKNIERIYGEMCEKLDDVKKFPTGDKLVTGGEIKKIFNGRQTCHGGVTNLSRSPLYPPFNNKINKEKKENIKRKFGDWVALTDEEYDSLHKEFGKYLVDKKILDMEAYCSEKRVRAYKDCAKQLRSWCAKEKKPEKDEDETVKRSKVILQHITERNDHLIANDMILIHNDHVTLRKKTKEGIFTHVRSVDFSDRFFLDQCAAWSNQTGIKIKL